MRVDKFEGGLKMWADESKMFKGSHRKCNHTRVGIILFIITHYSYRIQHMKWSEIKINLLYQFDEFLLTFWIIIINMKNFNIIKLHLSHNLGYNNWFHCISQSYVIQLMLPTLMPKHIINAFRNVIAENISK